MPNPWLLIAAFVATGCASTGPAAPSVELGARTVKTATAGYDRQRAETYSITCPPGYVATGLAGGAGLYIDHMALVCTSLDGAGVRIVKPAGTTPPAATATATSEAIRTLEAICKRGNANACADVADELLRRSSDATAAAARGYYHRAFTQLRLQLRQAEQKAAACRRTSAAAQPKSTPIPISNGVKKTGAYSYDLDRAMLKRQLADLAKLGSQARIVPNYRNRKYKGFKLVGVRPGSLYRAIGILSGDVILSINGKAIDSPNKAITLFERLKGTSSVTLGIERRGTPRTLTYTIREFR